jgi:hypothetical protein
MKASLLTRITALAQRAQAANAAKNSPNFRWDFPKIDAVEKEFCAEMEAINKAAGPGLAVGRTLTFGVADGRASYIITKIRKNNVVVEWIPMGDNYSSPAVGLSADRTQYIVLRSTAEQYCHFL